MDTVLLSWHLDALWLLWELESCVVKIKVKTDVNIYVFLRDDFKIALLFCIYIYKFEKQIFLIMTPHNMKT